MILVVILSPNPVSVTSVLMLFSRDHCYILCWIAGQSQPPCHLSMFLEVTDPRNTSADWSCFVSHRLSVVNQRTDERSVTKESQNRYSKAAKDWGWREFVTLTSLFDQDSGFLVQDMVVFSAEVLILKETSTMLELPEYEGEAPAAVGGSDTGRIVNRGTFTWRVENFLAFKEIMETRKIFSKFFQAGGCELRIGKILRLLNDRLIFSTIDVSNFHLGSSF